MKKKFLILFFSAILLPVSALAATAYSVSIGNPLNQPGAPQNIPQLITKVAGAVGEVVAGVGIVALLVAAVFFVTAAGSEEQYSKAKKALIYAIIGMAVGLGATVLSNVIQNIVGVQSAPVAAPHSVAARSLTGINNDRLDYLNSGMDFLLTQPLSRETVAFMSEIQRQISDLEDANAQLNGVQTASIEKQAAINNVFDKFFKGTVAFAATTDSAQKVKQIAQINSQIAAANDISNKDQTKWTANCSRTDNMTMSQKDCDALKKKIDNIKTNIVNLGKKLNTLTNIPPSGQPSPKTGGAVNTGTSAANAIAPTQLPVSSGGGGVSGGGSGFTSHPLLSHQELIQNLQNKMANWMNQNGNNESGSSGSPTPTPGSHAPSPSTNKGLTPTGKSNGLTVAEDGTVMVNDKGVPTSIYAYGVGVTEAGAALGYYINEKNGRLYNLYDKKVYVPPGANQASNSNSDSNTTSITSGSGEKIKVTSEITVFGDVGVPEQIAKLSKAIEAEKAKDNPNELKIMSLEMKRDTYQALDDLGIKNLSGDRLSIPDDPSILVATTLAKKDELSAAITDKQYEINRLQEEMKNNPNDKDLQKRDSDLISAAQTFVSNTQYQIDQGDRLVTKVSNDVVTQLNQNIQGFLGEKAEALADGKIGIASIIDMEIDTANQSLPLFTPHATQPGQPGPIGYWFQAPPPTDPDSPLRDSNGDIILDENKQPIPGPMLGSDGKPILGQWLYADPPNPSAKPGDPDYGAYTVLGETGEIYYHYIDPDTNQYKTSFVIKNIDMPDGYQVINTEGGEVNGVMFTNPATGLPYTFGQAPAKIFGEESPSGPTGPDECSEKADGTCTDWSDCYTSPINTNNCKPICSTCGGVPKSNCNPNQPCQDGSGSCYSGSDTSCPNQCSDCETAPPPPDCSASSACGDNTPCYPGNDAQCGSLHLPNAPFWCSDCSTTGHGASPGCHGPNNSCDPNAGDTYVNCPDCSVTPSTGCHGPNDTCQIGDTYATCPLCPQDITDCTYYGLCPDGTTPCQNSPYCPDWCGSSLICPTTQSCTCDDGSATTPNGSCYCPDSGTYICSNGVNTCPSTPSSCTCPDGSDCPNNDVTQCSSGQDFGFCDDGYTSCTDYYCSNCPSAPQTCYCPSNYEYSGDAYDCGDLSQCGALCQNYTETCSNGYQYDDWCYDEWNEDYYYCGYWVPPVIETCNTCDSTCCGL